MKIFSKAYAFGKYLGLLNVTFDEDGEATEWSGNPILMDSSIPQGKLYALLFKIKRSFL